VSALEGHVTGEEFTRLPHESPFSVAARIMWLNSLPYIQFSRICGATSARKSSLWEYGGGIDRNLDVLMGWTSQKRSAERDARRLFSWSPVWFVDRLRLCPECAHALYHSVWHQSRTLDRCPLHDHVLIDACWQCGRAFGEYAFTRSILQSPYECAYCCAPLTSRGLPSIASHARRDRRAALSLVSLEPFLTFVDRTAIDRWWDTWEMIFKIAQSLSANVHNGDRPEHTVSWLLWADEASASNDDPGLSTQTYSDRHLEEADLVYMETLAGLKLWLTKAYGHEVPNEQHFSQIEENDLLVHEATPPAVLAYIQLRAAWEGGGPKGLHSPIGDARVVRWRPPSARIWPTTLSSLGWEAVFRTTFAAFYWKLKRGRPAFGELSTTAGFDTYFQYQVSPTLRISATLFPTIDGMPLGHFDPSRLRLRDAFDLLRLAHRRNRRVNDDLRRAVNRDFGDYGGEPISVVVKGRTINAPLRGASRPNWPRKPAASSPQWHKIRDFSHVESRLGPGINEYMTVGRNDAAAFSLAPQIRCEPSHHRINLMPT